MSERGIVTPEAVPLEFQTGGVGSRGIAFFIDAAIYISITVVLDIAAVAGFVASNAVPPWIGISIVILITFLLTMGYPIIFETLWGGRTPGKAALRLRVVTQEGGPVGFRHAFIRAALGLLDFWASSGGVAIVSALLTADNQRLGDLAAGTIVVRERGGRTPPRPAVFAAPEGLEAYARMLDVSALRHREYAPIRSFLLRARNLQPQRRQAIADRLAEQIATRVRPPAAPRQITAEEFLRCVASAYQARHAPADRVGDQADSPLASVPLPAEVAGTAVEGREQPAPLSGGAAADDVRTSRTAPSEEEPQPPAGRGGFVPPA